MKSFPLRTLLWLAPLALPGVSSAAFHFFDPTDPANAPATISAAGVYSNIGNKTTDTALKYFEVNAPLWSDNASKKRWIALPPGKHIPWSDTTDVLDYPDSTIFVKLFMHDSVLGDSTTRFYWETRLLVNHKDGDGNNAWYGFSYKWNKAQTEATLVDAFGFDTTMIYYPNGLAQPQSYRKWHFPAQGDCWQCHRPEAGARGVLGFLPPQLKRPAPLQAGINQVTWLFNQGVFSGTQPNSTQLARRWKSVHDSIPSGLSADERFRVIDTMARSYLAANCSGCHGIRGSQVEAHGHNAVEYEFYNLFPTIEFGNFGTSFRDLNTPDDELDTVSYHEPIGRYKYLLEMKHAGISTAPGAIWNMAPSQTHDPALVVPGIPSYSTLPFRVLSRLTPAADSAHLYQNLYYYDGDGWKNWIFKARWGSKAWRDSLAVHGVSFNDVMTQIGGFGSDGDQMPPLASYEPDTAALKILGEWVKTYRTLYVVDSNAIATRTVGRALARSVSPTVSNRVLLVPENWQGRVQMMGINGRAYPLSPAGKGRYAIPQSVPNGVYFFRIGKRQFRASILRQ